MRRRLFECAACGRQTSVTAGTIFQDTRSPLTVWFRAMWTVTSQKTGTSALTLQQVLGLGSYQTAWTWLHKLRRAMVRPSRDRLAGHVEVDETFVGGVEDGVSGRGAKKKALIAVAAEDVGQRLGRIRLRRVPDASANSLQGFIDAVVEPGSQVHTDDWLGYERVCQGRSKIRPRWRRKTRPAGHWTECLKAAVRGKASGPRGGRVLAGVLAVCEAIAVAVQLQDVDVMGESVEACTG